MRKLLALALLLSTFCAIVGCGSGTVEEAPATTSEPSKGKAGGGGAGKMTNYRGVDE